MPVTGLPSPSITRNIPTDVFWTLPQSFRTDGKPRRTGIEIEFAGLEERAVSRFVRDLWGGTVTDGGKHTLVIEGSRIGDVEVTLDTAYKAHAGNAVTDGALQIARAVVPVEVVMPPLEHARLGEADRLVAALRRMGGEGTRRHLQYGFGVHLNPEIVAPGADAIIPTLRAYALLEGWMRVADPIDLARWLLPFVNSYPPGFIDLLAAEAQDWTVPELVAAYLHHCPTRNHGLDMLPMLAWIAPEAFAGRFAMHAAKARPTWHFRLPESRVDESGWSIAYEWNRWVIVERVAERAALLARLSDAWVAHRNRLMAPASDWAQRVEDELVAERIWQP